MRRGAARRSRSVGVAWRSPPRRAPRCPAVVQRTPPDPDAHVFGVAGPGRGQPLGKRPGRCGRSARRCWCPRPPPPGRRACWGCPRCRADCGRWPGSAVANSSVMRARNRPSRPGVFCVPAVCARSPSGPRWLQVRLRLHPCLQHRAHCLPVADPVGFRGQPPGHLGNAETAWIGAEAARVLRVPSNLGDQRHAWGLSLAREWFAKVDSSSPNKQGWKVEDGSDHRSQTAR